MDKILAAKETPKQVRGDTQNSSNSKLVPSNYADTSEAGGHVERSEASIWEKQIDTLVYALYNLTEDEIKIVEEQK